MRSLRLLPVLALLLIGALAACGASTPAAKLPTAPTSTAGVATAGVDGIPTSVTAEGYHVLGQANAPITIEHFSDFL